MAYYSPWNMNVAKRYESLSGTKVPSAAILDSSMRSKMALALREKGLQDDQDSYNKGLADYDKRLAEERRRFDIESADRRSAIESQKDSSLTSSLTGLGTTGAMLLGKEGIKDLASYGASGIKGLFDAGNTTSSLSSIKDIGSIYSGASEPGVLQSVFSQTSEVPSIATNSGNLITQTPSSNLSIVPSAAETGEMGFGTTVGSKIGQIGKPTSAIGGSLGSSIGSGIGSGVGEITGSTTASATGSAIGSAVGSAIGYAAPYYALAKLGGMAINAITANNPYLVETPFGRLGGSLDRPEDVEGYWGREAADHGIGNEEINKTIASGANPLGGLLYNTRDTIGNAVIAPDPVTLGATNVLSGVAKQVLGEETGNQVNSLLSLGTSTLGNIGTSTEATVDAGLNIATGGLWGAATGGGCVIVTACTDRHAPEVEIAREYRDKYLSPDQLRGYYMIAEKVVPRIERSNRLKKFVKRILVDNLIEYGSYKLGITEKKPSLKSVIISKVFLGTIKSIGYMLPQYIRLNGEVY